MVKEKLKKKQIVFPSWLKESFVPLAVVIIILVFSLVFLRVVVVRTIALFKENKRFKKQLTALTVKANMLSKADEAALENQVNMVEKTFPSKKPSVSLLATLSSLSEEEDVLFSGVKLAPGKIEEIKKEGEIKRSKEVVRGKIEDFSVEFSVEGSLSNISEFISRLEKIAPVMKVETFALKLREGQIAGLAGGQVKASLGVKVFYQTAPEAIGPIEQELPSFTPEEEVLLAELSGFETGVALLPAMVVGQENLFGPPRR